MQFPLLVPSDEAMPDVSPGCRLDSTARSCLQQAVGMQAHAQPAGFRQLEPPGTPHLAARHRIGAGS